MSRRRREVKKRLRNMLDLIETNESDKILYRVNMGLMYSRTMGAILECTVNVSL
ncbi:hypothetical protein Hanom_Chr11g00999431 [Helianthus anomalus]